MEKEEKAAGPGVFHGVFDKVNDGLALELGKAAEAKAACNDNMLLFCFLKQKKVLLP